MLFLILKHFVFLHNWWITWLFLWFGVYVPFYNILMIEWIFSFIFYHFPGWFFFKYFHQVYIFLKDGFWYSAILFFFLGGNYGWYINQWMLFCYISSHSSPLSYRTLHSSVFIDAAVFLYKKMLTSEATLSNLFL